MKTIESKPPRCKFVLAIINSKLETLELIREDIYPSMSETGENDPFEFAVVKIKETPFEVLIPIQSVVFLN